MSKAYESVMDGLNEALAFAEGKSSGAVIHSTEMPMVNVAIRARTGLSQSSFA